MTATGMKRKTNIDKNTWCIYGCFAIRSKYPSSGHESWDRCFYLRYIWYSGILTSNSIYMLNFWNINFVMLFAIDQNLSLSNIFLIKGGHIYTTNSSNMKPNYFLTYMMRKTKIQYIVQIDPFNGFKSRI